MSGLNQQFGKLPHLVRGAESSNLSVSANIMTQSYIRVRSKKLIAEANFFASKHKLSLKKLKTLQNKCLHPNLQRTDVPGDYYSKGWEEIYCPDCHFPEN